MTKKTFIEQVEEVSEQDDINQMKEFEEDNNIVMINRILEGVRLLMSVPNLKLKCTFTNKNDETEHIIVLDKLIKIEAINDESKNN